MEVQNSALPTELPAISNWLLAPVANLLYFAALGLRDCWIRLTIVVLEARAVLLGFSGATVANELAQTSIQSSYQRANS